MENEATTPSLPAKTLDTASEETSPVAESGTKLLTEDAFSSERSQRLFEAIDELQSCGANRDIELPEVSPTVISSVGHGIDHCSL